MSPKLNRTSHSEYQWAAPLLLCTSGLNPENSRHQRKYQTTQEKKKMDYQTSLYALMRQSLFSPPLNYLPQHSEKKGNAECCCPS